jgi:hypothetical protein
MRKRLRICRRVELQNCIHIGNIQSSRGDISGQEQRWTLGSRTGVCERIQCSCPNGRREMTVKREKLGSIW